MTSGKVDEIKGRVKQAAGVLTGDKKMETEGEAQKVVGKVKQNVEKVVEKIKDSLD